jgi:hypothetical protein
MIKFVYKILPAFVIYTSDLPENKGGVANGFIVRIKPKYKSDNGILQHELTHIKQWYRTFTFHSLLYLFNKKYRLSSEVEAYREQLKYYLDDRTDLFAKFIAEDYNLDVERDNVIGMLKNGS